MKKASVVVVWLIFLMSFNNSTKSVVETSQVVDDVQLKEGMLALPGDLMNLLGRFVGLLYHKKLKPTQLHGKHFGGARSIVFDASHSKAVTTGHHDPVTCVWDVQKGVLLHRLCIYNERSSSLRIACLTIALRRGALFGRHHVTSSLFNTNGDRVLTGDHTGTVYFWNNDTGKLERRYSCHTSTVNAIALHSSDTQMVTASRDGTVKVWSMPGGVPLHSLSGHAGGVLHVGLNAPNSIITGDARGRYYFWEPASNWYTELVIESHRKKVGFNKKGTHILAWDGKKTKTWNIATRAWESCYGDFAAGSFSDTPYMGHIQKNEPDTVMLYDPDTLKIRYKFQDGHSVMYYSGDRYVIPVIVTRSHDGCRVYRIAEHALQILKSARSSEA